MFTVDVPPSNPEFERWNTIAYFLTRKEAVEFAKKYFGADNEGKISLVSPIVKDDDYE